MKYPIHLIKLIETLKKLPGVGSKSAERFAFHMLEWPSERLKEMGAVITGVTENLYHCPTCGCLGGFSLAGVAECHFCLPERVESHALCIIASAKDAFAIEATGEFRGIYHVLGALLSPMDGKGAEVLNIEKLLQRISDGQIEEVVIALDSTLEGDATALYLKSALANRTLKVSRLAFGLPMGSALEYVDGGTLARAFSSRSPY